MTEPKINGLVQRFLTKFKLFGPSLGWGFAIFRTVYTPESYQEWKSILAKIEAYVRLEVLADVGGARSGYDPEPSRMIIERFRNVIFDDKESFDRVGFDVIYDTFRGWIEVNRQGDGMWVASKACLVIDEEVFETLRDAPNPEGAEEAYYIKMLDCIYKHQDAYGAPNPQYPVWVKADVAELWRVYMIIDITIGLKTRCEKGKDGVLYFE